MSKVPRPEEFFLEKNFRPFCQTWKRHSSYLCGYSMFEKEENVGSERERLWEKVEKKSYENERESRAVGALFGLVIGDALGAPLEFSPYKFDQKTIKDFKDDIWNQPFYNRFQLKPGQWTDDSSMALCLADSLLATKGILDPIDLRRRFSLWWHFGYCNAFSGEENRHSVGLGGNISMSLSEFEKDGTSTFTKMGDELTSGNGSLMRLAPVPIMFAKQVAENETKLETALQTAGDQSKTTHQGVEAAETCKLMTYILINNINSDGDPKAVLESLPKSFKSHLHSVQCLAGSKQEYEKTTENNGWSFADRDWNWRKKDYEYSEKRANQNPGYIGSYAMDALAMALHCVNSTSSFCDAVLKAANLHGDSDTVAAITGQIAGSMYGADAIPLEWIQTILQHDKHKDIILRAFRLYHNQWLKTSS